MKTSLTRIGNSKGLIIPAQILKQCGLTDEVSLEVKEDSLIISKPKNPREGWEEAIQAAGADDLLLDDFPNDFDVAEWTW